MLAIASCSKPAAPTDRPRNAIVILLDTVRADHVSCYGYARPTTPAIDAFAAQSVVFETVIASAPWTKPSICSLLAALQPSQTFDNEGRLTSSLVESFRKAGLATAAITEGGFFSRLQGMDRGFEHFVEEEGAVQALKPGQMPNEHPIGGIDHTFSLAREWLAANHDKPFFLLVHTYEPHTPYTNDDFARELSRGRLPQTFTFDLLPRLQSGELALTAAETEYVKALYDSDLLNTDRHVGKLLAFLKEQGLDRDTLVVITSDHGEELGEHNREHIGDHGHGLHDSLLRVPLIVRDPTQSFASQRIKSQVRVIDVLPTVAELMHVPIAERLHGASLVPLMTGADTQDRPALLGWTSYGPAVIGLRDGGFKYVTRIQNGVPGRPMIHPPPPCELYDLTRDPLELQNLCTSKPKLVQAMHATLNERAAGLDLQKAVAPDTPTDARLLERLRSLGYVR